MAQVSHLSEHFTLAEAVLSQEADRRDIDNSHPDPQIITTASKTAVKLEKVRLILDSKPIGINSWIRSLLLNRALGSKDSSQHVLGEAVDFICPTFGTPFEICKRLVENKLLVGFDQLILEHSWVHISWKSIPNATQRGEVLSLLQGGGYAKGLTDKSGKALI
jgi:hypothetical protein